MLSHLAGQSILVTGGTGFLGRHLLSELQNTGANIFALCRSRTAAQKLPAGVTPVAGDCADLASIKQAVQAKDYVIHLAALLFGSTWQDYLAANGLAAQNLGQAIASESQCHRIVFVSSLAAAGPCGQLPGRAETSPVAPVSAYGWSKYLAEKILGSFAGQRLVVLRPPIIYGSGDKGLLPLFRSCAKGIGLAPKNFPVSIIHASDCARAIHLACDPKASGVYHLSDGKAYDMSTICKAMGKAQGKDKVLTFAPPRAIMAASAALGGMAHRAANSVCRWLNLPGLRAPSWNWDKYRESAQAGWLANGGKIVAELGFAPQMTLETGMAEAVAGYRKEGWL